MYDQSLCGRLISLDEDLSSKRYEPPIINLENKNSSHTRLIELTGKHKNVLEIGTSTGYISKILKDRGNTVTGIEIDPEAGAIAQTVCDRMIIGDVETLDFSTGFEPYSFDVVLCGDILEHLKNPARVLKNLHKILRPEGYLVVSLPNFLHGDVLLNLLCGDFHYTSLGLLDETHLRFFGQKNVFQLFADCSYQITDFTTTNRGVGTTELKVDDGKIPKNVMEFIKSLPNTTVYQFIFTAHPSLQVTIPPFAESEISTQESGSLEKYQTRESEISRLFDELTLKDNHIKNLDAVILAKDAQIESERSGFSEVLTLKDNHIKNLDTVLLAKDAQIQAAEAQSRLLSDNYASSLAELEQVQKEIVDKDRHIVNIEEELRIRNMNIFQKLFHTCYSSVQKHSPAGTKRGKFVELVGGAATLYSTEGFLSVTNRALSMVKDSYAGNVDLARSPFLSIDIHHLPGTVPFCLEQELSGQFTCPVDDLDEIRIGMATYGRKNADVLFQLKERGNEKATRMVTVKGTTLMNDTWTRIRFDPVRDSRNKTYQFFLKSAGSPAAAVWYNPDKTMSRLQLLNENGPVPGSIGLKCFSAKKIIDPYAVWIFNNEPTQQQLKECARKIRCFSYQPKISIITPVWNTDEKWLRLAIESVINQVYDTWELCLVDGGSTRPHIRPILQEYAEKDPRIRVKFLKENKGIAENSNEALALATGDFTGFLDHDDELAPFTLYEVVKLLNRNPDLHCVYSDEDKIDGAGDRKDPFFKPDWSPDLFLSQNYLCHFSVIRKTLTDSAGGFRGGFDGSQDYDLFLRVMENLSPSAIGHIPKILYHWRTILGSAADHTDAKPYAFNSARKALQDALARRKINGEVQDGLFPSSYRIRYTIPDTPKVSIIIPTKDNVRVLQRCIDSILGRTVYKNYEIILVDNQSVKKETADYYDHLKDNQRIRILSYDRPFNFSAINNYAVSKVTSPYILFLNNDTEVISGEWLSAMLEHARRDTTGAVGAKLLYPDGRIQHAGIILGITGTPGQKGVAGHVHKYIPDKNPGYFLRPHVIGNTSGVTAACMLMKKDVFEKIGGFDENLAIAFNDVDLCMRIRENGYLIVYTPYARLFHHESLSRGHEDTPAKQQRFRQETEYVRKRWGSVIDSGDPYYNPNLTLEREDFSIQGVGEDV